MYPYASPEDLRICCDFLNLLFVIDDAQVPIPGGTGRPNAGLPVASGTSPSTNDTNKASGDAGDAGGAGDVSTPAEAKTKKKPALPRRLIIVQLEDLVRFS